MQMKLLPGKNAMLFVVFLLLSGIAVAQSKQKQKPVIIGYVGGYGGRMVSDTIDVKRLSHINYAFVDIKDNRAWLHSEATDTVNLRKLVAFKKQNPALKILISIGGWTWSKNFSDAVLTDTSTCNFARSAVDIVTKYNLDGVDIDWEYPGMMGDSNVYRQQDKENYTNLFKQLRSQLDSVGKIDGKKYLVTTAVGGSMAYIEHTEMDKVQLYTDYINIMSYDYDGDSVSSHHTNLYTSSGYEHLSSADKSVQNFIKAGVPPNKIVMGVAFYGKGRLLDSSASRGLYSKFIKQVRGGGYTYLKDSVVNQNGYKRYWDKRAKAPYLFNKQQKIFITYDDEKSIRQKCKYIKKYDLAGAMFWEYSSDRKGYLLKVIADHFKYDVD
jgi:chitinase